MGLLWGCVAALIANTLLLVWVVNRLVQVHVEHTADHAKCIAHVSDIVSNRIVAMAIRRLAERWDSVEERALLHSLRREYSDTSGSVGARWLLLQAEAIDPTPDFANAEYTLDGRRVL